MKKTTTEMAAAIHAQASKERNSKDATKVQNFIDMCKSLERKTWEIKPKSSIRKDKRALILMIEHYQKGNGYPIISYRIEREYIGRISQIGFSIDSAHRPIITMEGAEKVVRCYESGELIASCMEKAGSVNLLINEIESITYII